MFRSPKAALLVAATAAMLLTGCGSDEPNAGADGFAATSADASAASQVEFSGTLPEPCTLVSKEFTAQVMGGDVELSTIDGDISHVKGIRSKTCVYYQNSPRVEVNIATFTYADIDAAWKDDLLGALHISGTPAPTSVAEIGDRALALVFMEPNNMGIVAFRRGGIAVKVVVQDPREGATYEQSVQRAEEIAKKVAEAQF